MRMAVERRTPTTIEDDGDNTFCWRIQPLDARDLGSIMELDEDVSSRTQAVRAAIRDYAKKLRKRAERKVAA